jgi:hypothetical protein
MRDANTERDQRRLPGKSRWKLVAIGLVAVGGLSLGLPIAVGVDTAASVVPAWQRSPDPGFPN